MIEEIWKDIEDFEGLYQISNFGRVKALTKIVNYSDGRRRHYDEKILKPRIQDGYENVELHHNLIKFHKGIMVHRLVCLAFIPNQENKRCINHKDFDPGNNFVDNLEWVTHKENTQYSLKAKRIHPNCISISDETVNEIIDLYFNKNMPGTMIAKQFGLKCGRI